ncbi:MAG TPA: hypothetical protein VKR27_00360 [Acidimicrobiales bacterium]|nr:hypothetical protein [Acidimicrobiales bacterium]
MVPPRSATKRLPRHVTSQCRQWLAVLDRWRLIPDLARTEVSLDDLDDSQRLTRDIYVPAGDVGFWQGALREPGDQMFEQAKAVISERRPFLVDLLYRDHDGGQCTVNRFRYRPTAEDLWLIAVARHWNLDRPPPAEETETQFESPPRARSGPVDECSY